LATNVVIQTAFLGDLLLSIPLLKRIKSLSDESLTLVCRHGLGEFFLKTKVVDQVIEIEKGHRKTYENATAELNKLDLHTVFVPHQSVRSHLFGASLKAPHKVGFSTWWNQFFFNHRIKKDMSLPDAIRQQSLLKVSDPALEALIKKYKHGREAYKVKNTLMTAPPPWSSLSLRDNLLADKSTWARLLERRGLSARRDQPWILIFPGSVWATKRWTLEGFAAVTRSLMEQKYEVFLMGAPNEERLCNEIAEQAPGCHVLAGQTTIYESALMLAHAVLAIGNDSASMHLASCAEIPLVSIFGPTVIEFGFRPWSENAHVVQHPHLACRPCGPHGHRECPLKTHKCMKDISADTVLSAVKATLQSNLSR
jgi:heptosyltransferase-2